MIYTEVIHLNADNKVLIEVLDGRSVRLTIDAMPMEVFFDKKKVISINIDGQPYLSLEVFNKVFVVINDKLHTYSITEIDDIGENCFQCHTMARTKSSFFITPILGDNRNDVKWGQYFVNTFLSDNSITVLYRYFNVEDFQVFEHSLHKHPLFQKLIDHDTQHIAVQFKVPQQMKHNLKLFSEGQYSKMDDDYKEKILKFHGLSKETLIGKILFKSEERKRQLELDLGVSIPPDIELYDKPDSREYFKLNEELILEI